MPLLEAQYAGLPIVAPNAAIFREVLGQSGIFIDPSDPKAAAATIAGLLANGAWRSRYVTLGADNLTRWNALTRADRDAGLGFFKGLELGLEHFTSRLRLRGQVRNVSCFWHGWCF